MTKKLAWSDDEDQRLTSVIESRRIYTKSDGRCTINASWGEIAELMPNRSAKQCRERWCYNLNPAIKRDTWSINEDAILMKAQSILGNQWALIARHLPGRTENSVKTRHKSIMRAKRRAWSKEEDEVILSMHRQIGSRWEKIAERLLSRTSNGVKTRFGLLRKGLAHGTPVEGAPEQILNKPELINEVKLDIPKQPKGRRAKRRRNFFNIPASELIEESLDPVEIGIGTLLSEMVNQIASKAGEEIPHNRQPQKKRRGGENKKKKKNSANVKLPQVLPAVQSTDAFPLATGLSTVDNIQNVGLTAAATSPSLFATSVLQAPMMYPNQLFNQYTFQQQALQQAQMQQAQMQQSMLARPLQVPPYNLYQSGAQQMNPFLLQQAMLMNPFQYQQF